MPIGLTIKNYHFSKPVQPKPPEPVKPEPKPEPPKRPILHLKGKK